MMIPPTRRTRTSTPMLSMCLLITMLMLAMTQTDGFVAQVPSQQQDIRRSSHHLSSSSSLNGRRQLMVTTTPTTTTTTLSMIGDLFSGGGGGGSSSSQLLLNDKTIALQESLVANTSLQNKALKCVYRGSVDGWSAINFHNNVDGKGSCLVVILTRSGKLIGGFNPVGWRSTDDYYDSNSAFLWYATGRGPTSTATKCPILTGGT